MSTKEQLESVKIEIIADCDKNLKELTDNDKIVVLIDFKEKVINGDFDASIMAQFVPYDFTPSSRYSLPPRN